MKKILIFIALVMLLIIIVNVAYIPSITEKGLMIKVKPAVVILSHGRHIYTTSESGHMILLNYTDKPTYQVLDKLKEEGYNYFFLSACETKKEKYILDMTNIFNNYTLYWDGYNVYKIPNVWNYVPTIYNKDVNQSERNI